MIDLDMLRLQAAKTGLGIKYLSKEEQISILLIQLHELFPDNVVLKGGTALNRGYLQSQQKGRFSEDIDLDYILKQPLDTKITRIKTIMQKLSEFIVSPPRIHHHTLRFDCQYTNQLDEKDRVQVEFYLDKKKPAVRPQMILLQPQYIPAPGTLFKVYSLDDLLAQKLMALYNRGEGKDIYDVFYVLDMPFKKNIVKNALSDLLIYHHIKLEYGNFLKDLIKKVDTLQSNAQYIGNSTNHFIPRSLRPDWVVFIRTLQEKITQNL
jgi:predicted nucleotidyltransferase component of viral defense system